MNKINDRTVRVSGSEFRKAPAYQVKLEGAAIMGYRCIFIGGIRDPILIAQIDQFLEQIRTFLCMRYPELQSGESKLYFHIYGKETQSWEFRSPRKTSSPLK